MPEITKTYSMDELKAMEPEARRSLILGAVKVSGTVVVRRQDGSIKYDDPSLAGTYNEPAQLPDTE